MVAARLEPKEAARVRRSRRHTHPGHDQDDRRLRPPFSGAGLVGGGGPPGTQGGGRSRRHAYPGHDQDDRRPRSSYYLWRRACRRWRPAWNPRRRPKLAATLTQAMTRTTGTHCPPVSGAGLVGGGGAAWNPRRRPKPPPRSPRPSPGRTTPMPSIYRAGVSAGGGPFGTQRGGPRVRRRRRHATQAMTKTDRPLVPSRVTARGLIGGGRAHLEPKEAGPRGRHRRRHAHPGHDQDERPRCSSWLARGACRRWRPAWNPRRRPQLPPRSPRP